MLQVDIDVVSRVAVPLRPGAPFSTRPMQGLRLVDGGIGEREVIRNFLRYLATGGSSVGGVDSGIVSRQK